MLFNVSRLVLCTVFLLLSSQIMAQTTRVLIVGDSWAEFQWLDGVHANVFSANGYVSIQADGASTAIGGTTAADWANEGLMLLTEAIAENSQIDTVQLTIGGNDFLGAWSAGLSEQQQVTIRNSIVANIQTIVSHLLIQRSDIEVVLSFYDYLNFEDTLAGFCVPLYQDIGQPTTLNLNTVMRDFEQAYAQIAAAHSRVYYVSHLGLLQFTYGFPNQDIQPGDITPPGDINRPSPVAALRDADGGPDCIHLNSAGNQVIIQNVFDQYFRKRFDTVFKSGFE